MRVLHTVVWVKARRPDIHGILFPWRPSSNPCLFHKWLAGILVSVGFFLHSMFALPCLLLNLSFWDHHVGSHHQVRDHHVRYFSLLGLCFLKPIWVIHRLMTVAQLSPVRKNRPRQVWVLHTLIKWKTNAEGFR